MWVFILMWPLCVILPQIHGYIKNFDDGGKNMTFVTDNEKVYERNTGSN